MKVPKGTQVGDFGYAELPLFELRDGKIRSKALDNVGGCAAIVAALDHMSRLKLPGDVTAIFTRAEEVGFHGTLAAIKLRTLPKSVPVVVLECSKAMPGAEFGKGPVIRVGDRVSIFDSDTATAMELAAKTAAGKKGPKWQRRLMDGGACEATAFCIEGYRSAGFAFPLGNYHNVGKGTLSAEYIHASDFLDGTHLLAAFGADGLGVDAAHKRLSKWLYSRFGAKELSRLKRSALS